MNKYNAIQDIVPVAYLGPDLCAVVNSLVSTSLSL